MNGESGVTTLGGGDGDGVGVGVFSGSKGVGSGVGGGDQEQPAVEANEIGLLSLALSNSSKKGAKQ